jgi:hypothetical protein
MDFKKFHLGTLIKSRVQELDISISRLTKFLKCSEADLDEMYSSESLDMLLVLRWCKILEYDFFRLYSHHLILYAPALEHSKTGLQEKDKPKSLPQFRKNIYSEELINYILEMIRSGKKTKLQVIEEYGIPKTTLYKWISKRTIIKSK